MFKKFLLFSVIALSVFSLVSDTSATFYANSFYNSSGPTSINVYSSGYINGYYLGTLPVNNTPYFLGNVTTLPILVSTGTKMYYTIYTEGASFGYCSLDSYSGATRIGIGLFCPSARLFTSANSNILLGATGSIGLIGATGATGPMGSTGATGSYIDNSIIFSGSNIEISYDIEHCDYRQGICTINTYTRFPVLANGAEIMTETGFLILPTVSTEKGVDIGVQYDTGASCGWHFLTIPMDNYVPYLYYINANLFDVSIPFEIVGCPGYDYYVPPSSDTGTLSATDSYYELGQYINGTYYLNYTTLTWVVITILLFTVMTLSLFAFYKRYLVGKKSS